jgi:hypothetical protein
MDFVSVSMEKQGNKREWSRRIFGECPQITSIYERQPESTANLSCVWVDWDEMDMRQTEVGSRGEWLHQSESSSVMRRIELWNTGARCDYAIEPPAINTPV